MSSPAECRLIGRWRIVEADLWDRAYLDLAGQACFEIRRNGWAQFAFGALDATAELEYGRTIVFFRWTGFDEATRSPATERPNSRTTAPSKSSCPLTTAMTSPSPAVANDFFNSLLAESYRNDPFRSAATHAGVAGPGA